MNGKSLLKGTMSIVFWVAVLFSFLFVPRVANYFKSQKSINISLWAGVIDPQLFKKFEKETGIHVNVSYFESNEELLVKLAATKGKGYDLIAPSDYIVHFLRKNNLLQKLDKSKLNFYDDLNHKLMGHYFDPLNEYSVPSEWYLLGLGINKNHFSGSLPKATWATIFDPQLMPDHIGLINDSRELIGLAIKYKYNAHRGITDKELLEIKEVMLAQKKKAEAYTDFRGDFLLESGNCSVVIVGNSIIWKTVRDNPQNISFIIPEEGTFLGIENYVIPCASKKADLVYQLLNFFFKEENQKHNFEYGVFLSSRKDADYMFNTPELKLSMKYIHPDTPEKAWPYQNFLTDEQVNDIWLEVKGK